MTVAVTLAGGNKFVTLMCCSDDVILGIGIGYWYSWRPIVLGMFRGIFLTPLLAHYNSNYDDKRNNKRLVLQVWCCVNTTNMADQDYSVQDQYSYTIN